MPDQHILFISHVHSPRRNNGGAIYSDAILNALQVLRPGHVTVAHVFEEQVSGSRWRQPAAIIGSLLSGIPSKYLYFYRRSFHRQLKALLRTLQPTVVFIDHVEMGVYWQALQTIPCKILISHNVEYRLHAERINALRPHLLRQILQGDITRFRQAELALARQVDGLICISSDDLAHYQAAGAAGAGVVLPPSFDYPPRENAPGRAANNKLRLGFIANLDWWPNRHGIEWFIETVFRQIADRYELHLIGKSSERFHAPESGLFGHGFVDDIRDAWRMADIYINPVQEGGGVNIKTAEAIYNRVPQIVSNHALRGLPLKADAAIVCCDSAAAWLNYLQSAAPDALAQRQITPQHAGLFTKQHLQDALQNLLETLTS